MPNPKATESPESSPDVRPPGRIRGALMVLRGEALVPDQIRCEWIEYQVTFSGILDRFGALLARQAKAEKRRLDEQLAEPQPPPHPDLVAVGPGEDRKADLRRRAAHLHLGTGVGRYGEPRSPHQDELDLKLARTGTGEEPT